MKKCEQAIARELNGEYIEAVKLYEAQLRDASNIPIDVYINLAFLYWEFAAEEIEFNDPNDIPGKWSTIGGKRYPEIIKLGLKEYPRSVELHFWRKYFPHRLFFDDFSQRECEQLVEKYGDKESLVPYFFLYLFDNEKYKKKRDGLCKDCRKLATAKNLYILGFC